jgi:outer membrane protein assembly factor BamB
VFLTLPILLGSVVLLAIWLIFFSRLERRLRRRTIGALVVLIATGAAALRVRGVTGDFVPVLEWRWAPRAEPAAELLPQPNVPPAATPAPAAIVPPPLAPPDPAPNPEPSAAAPVAAAAEFPQFLGPDRNGAVTGVHLAKDWTARSPRLLWRRRVGTGWSGFAVANGLAVTQEQRGDREMVIAYNLSDGLPRWSHGDIARFESTIAGDGPRATPTISRGRVFTLGSTGLLNCLDLETGKRIWRRDIGTDNDARQPEWGRSSSPLAVDDLVIVSAGGSNGRSLVAYHRESGEPVWRAGDDLPSYSSPVVATLAGLRQIVVLNQSVAAGHDLTTGRILWEHSWPRHQPSVAAPLILPGNRVLLSSGYGYGSRLLGISAGEAGLRESLLWGTPRLKAKFTNLVAHEGFVYGLDDGVLVCLDPADGERRWKSGRYGHGQAILAGKLLLVQTEDGDIVLVEPRPDEHRELTRFTAFSQKTWNPPALAGRLLLVRNDVEAACYELPIESR